MDGYIKDLKIRLSMFLLLFYHFNLKFVKSI
jgi:hypothetical protein